MVINKQKINVYEKSKISTDSGFTRFLVFLNSCEEEEWTTLPPETQTGANTFGCYVNNELFVAQRKYAPLGGKYLSAVYSGSAKILTIN
jgi:hypothetical protein